MVQTYWIYLVAALGLFTGFCVAAAIGARVIWRKNRRINYLNRRIEYLKEFGHPKDEKDWKGRLQGQVRDA